MAASLALGQWGAEGSAVTGEALSPLLAESGAWVPQCVEQGPAMPDELVSTMVQAQSDENKWDGSTVSSAVIGGPWHAAVRPRDAGMSLLVVFIL